MTPEERAREALLRCVSKPPWLEEYEPEVARAIREAVEDERRALLAELDAARAFIREIRGAMLIGGWRDKQSALLAAYDAVVKASET